MKYRNRQRHTEIPSRLAPAAMSELIQVASVASRSGQQLGPMELARLADAIAGRLAERSGLGWWRRLIGA